MTNKDQNLIETENVLDESKLDSISGGINRTDTTIKPKDNDTWQSWNPSSYMEEHGLSEEDLKHVSGGYKGFGDNDVDRGTCIMSFDMTGKNNMVSYYLVLTKINMTNEYTCLKWVTVNGEIIVNGEKCFTDFKDGSSTIIYCIEDNPPPFVHE